MIIDSLLRINLHNFCLDWREKNKTKAVKSKMEEDRRDELQPEKSQILRLKMTNLKQNLASTTTVI